MVAIVLALVSSLVYGVADFTGGLAARRSSVLRVSGVSSVMGFLVIAVSLPLLGGVWSRDAVIWGLASGALSCFVFVLLYKCLALGPMGILSPVIALVGASVPVLFALLTGDRVSVLGWIGIVLALTSVFVISFAYDPEHHRPTRPGLIMAVLCGLSVGSFFIVLSRAPSDSGSIPVFFNRALTSVVLVTSMLIAIYFRRRTSGGIRSGWSERSLPMAIAAGAMDTSANLLFLYSSRMGILSVVAVISSLYPASTVLCARFILNERLTRTQIGGLGVAAVAVSLLALAQT